jgi:cyclopropane fatty-acyl-phospholipid synthase-like methyltransferase
MQSPLSETEAVAQMYDSPEGQLGPIMFGGHLHWGYWDDDNADDNFPQAADKLAQLMIARTDIKPDQRFCDLGCGVGMPAMKLARAKGCYVDGVTISQFQQENATSRAQAEGLQERTKFLHANALHVPCEDHVYDGGWFFESIFHMGHRDALREASRILKPGATLLLTDLPTLPTTTDEFMQFVNQHIHSHFVAKEDYPALLDEAGFDLVEMWDISNNVMVPLVPKFKATLANHQQDIAASGATDKAIDDWIYTFEYMSENLGYMLVTAKKR